MIYLFIFMYLLICVILYDVYERKLHLRANYIVLYFLFTLIAGLRWRLGVDTVNYMNFFQYEMAPKIAIAITVTLAAIILCFVESFNLSFS